MIKQLTLVGLVATMFIGVWVLVIFQFDNSRYVDPISIENNQSERAIDLPESITSQDENRTDISNNEPESTKSTEPQSETRVAVVEEKESETKRSRVDDEPVKEVDLRDYDFSDISTSDGVPIDGILTKLELE
ncbi:hypothetical protein [Halalkalibacter nanhaiisediminis]|uniref:Uncharacterized protein n=1 Tax=Halalkalibacter nanhaiisediminis TaxID=688079 RepID=A0A562QQB6_9BACI|nr:hypothetical protein [Halalkalibacter nanhaiisediminis]TWI58939.1 hypothetical protein IQ10_00647 [Halalkalibacter nanhaiisediminis]